MRYLKNKVLFIFSAVAIGILIFAYFYMDESSIRDKAILSSLESGQGMNRIYDAKENLLEDCGFTEYQDILELNYVFYQNYDESVPYVLLIIADNKQQEFYVDGELYKKYYFTLEDLQYKNFKIKIDLKDSSPESIVIATYKEPDYRFSFDSTYENTEKWMSLVTDYTYLTRLFIKNSTSEKVSFKNDFDKEIHLPILQDEDRKGSFVGYAHDKRKLHFYMELYPEEMSYSLIYLLNYEQISLKENKDTIPVKAKTFSVDTDFTLPDVTEPSTFHILIIPHYNVLKDGIDMRVKNSIRIDVLPLE